MKFKLLAHWLIVSTLFSKLDPYMLLPLLSSWRNIKKKKNQVSFDVFGILPKQSLPNLLLRYF